MSKKQKGSGDEIAKQLAILNKPIEEQINDIVGAIEIDYDPCYDDDCNGCNSQAYVTGRSEATDKLVKLFRQYLQAELQRRGITEVI